jgi:pimeloyl-ACP methyl ester carboxylesterase
MIISRGVGVRRSASVAIGIVVALFAAAACSSSGSSKSAPAVGSTTTSAARTTTAPVERVVTMDGVVGPGPAKYNRVRVLEVGPADAKNVLVLEPGTSAGAAYFRLDAEDIVEHQPGWQVWSVDRRENLLEDHSALDAYLAGKRTQQQVFDYYLGWLSNPKISPHFQAPSDASVAFARQWGMDVAIGDLHNVIGAAKKLGGKVVLGGHSLGGAIATAYATWDFAGRAGGADLDGLVLIDGASGPGAPISVSDAQAQLQKLSTGSPFLDLVGLGLPWSAGVFNALGSTAVLHDPNTPSLAYAWPVFPKMLKPPVRPTNKAQYGYALDTKTGPASLKLVQMHIGELASSGDPRGWRNDGITPVERAAAAFAGISGMDGTSWYHPSKLSLDAGAVNGGIANPADALLDVHATHGKDLHFPIYAFATSLGNQRVLDAARALGTQSGLPASDVTLVDRASTYAHCDPISATPAKNDFLKTVEPFLANIG